MTPNSTSSPGQDQTDRTIVPPTDRTCERCGRTEQWNDDRETWQGVSGALGRPHCLHEWDITGAYNPLSE